MKRNGQKEWGNMTQLLIVDDEQGIRLLLKEVFKKENISTALAADGQEAITLATQQSFQCALVDMRMPGMSGLETLKALKVLDPQLPVIMMTAYGERDVIAEAQQIGIAGYFTKPFSIFDVRDTVQKILQA